GGRGLRRRAAGPRVHPPPGGGLRTAGLPPVGGRPRSRRRGGAELPPERLQTAPQQPQVAVQLGPEVVAQGVDRQKVGVHPPQGPQQRPLQRRRLRRTPQQRRRPAAAQRQQQRQRQQQPAP